MSPQLPAHGQGGDNASNNEDCLYLKAYPNDAAERVIALYWKPVHRFIHKFGKNNEDVKDLTQTSFASTLGRTFFERFDQDRSSFRAYLRMAVERFASSEYAASKRQKRGGDMDFESLEEVAVPGGSPEDVFERE